MNKKAKSVLFVCLAFLAVSMIVLLFVLASSNVIPISFNVEEDDSTLYNFTVNSTVNITQVNITLPVGFSITDSTNGTSAVFDVFVNTSNSASWTN